MIIDSKGRLFGLINIIDLGVIIFILLMIPMLFFGHKILNRPTDKLTWSRTVQCKFCGYDIGKKLEYGTAPSEEYVSVKCSRCGKEQQAFFGFGNKTSPEVGQINALQEQYGALVAQYDDLKVKYDAVSAEHALCVKGRRR